MNETGITIKKWLSHCNSWIILVNAAVFLFMDFFLPITSLQVLIDFGGLSWYAVIREGEYYRLLTYMFLHGGFEHLVNNMIVLIFIGETVERFLGRWKYLLIYFSTGIVAGIVSIVYNMNRGVYSLSIGASGAGFGIIGALACLLAVNRGRLAGMTMPRVLFFVAISLYGGFTSQGIDNAAHVGGLIMGVVVTAIVYFLTRRRGHEG